MQTVSRVSINPTQIVLDIFLSPNRKWSNQQISLMLEVVLQLFPENEKLTLL
jgi:hypothetical protein